MHRLVLLVLVLLLVACGPKREEASVEPGVVRLVNGYYNRVSRVVDEGACVVVYWWTGEKSGGISVLPVSETNLQVEGCP